MTFNPNIPNGGQSPGLFPTQNAANFTVLQDIINRDHIFNDSPGVGDNSGTHRQVNLTDRTDPVSLPTGTNGMIYLSSGIPRYYNGTRVMGLIPVLARITFNNGGVVQGTSLNATVAPPAAGIYTITFTVALPSIYPQISLTCIEPSTNPVICKILTFTVNSMTVRFVNQSGTTVSSITQANLIIFGS